MNQNKSSLTIPSHVLLALIMLSLLVDHTQADDYILSNNTHKSLVVALGCFWCAEQAFEQYAPGVIEAVSGYSCGTKAANTTGAAKCNEYPTYRNHPGHYEVVLIEYDPSMTSYELLVQYAWRNLDPFDGKGQFCDKGTSYLPAIFYANDEERIAATRVYNSILEDHPEWNVEDIAVPSLPRQTFWTAEEYHQNYYIKNPKSYGYYKNACGRTRRLKQVWGEDAYACYHNYELDQSESDCIDFFLPKVVNEEGEEVEAVINIKNAPQETIGAMPRWATILLSVSVVMVAIAFIACMTVKKKRKGSTNLPESNV